MDFEQLSKELKGIEQGLQEVLKTQSEEIKSQGETSKKTAADLKTAEAKYDAKVKEIEEKAQQLELKLGRLGMSQQQIEEAKSLGERFVESAEFKAFAEKRSTSAKIEVKALTSAVGSAGALITPQRVGLVQARMRPDHVRDLLNVGRTNSGSIEFPRETGFTNNAAPVAEGAQKPESNITFETVNMPVRTIAHWIPIAKQTRDDAPMLESLVNTRLVEGVLMAEDHELLYGNGTGQHLLGIIPQASVYKRYNPEDKMLHTLRRARTQVRLAEYQADGAVLNPTDWEEIELATGSDGHFIWVNVANGGEPRLWRMPVIETTVIDEGHFLVGAFNLGAQFFIREDATVEISEHDRDNFIKNMLTMRGEERGVLAVHRPESFVAGPFENPAGNATP